MRQTRYQWAAVSWGLFGQPSRAARWASARVPYVVRHCGHQTALRPYYLEGFPDGNVDGLVHAWRSLAEAQRAAEALAESRGTILNPELPAPAGCLI